MQDGGAFFSQKTTGNGFTPCFLSFLMGAFHERYDFTRKAGWGREIFVAFHAEL